LTLRIEAKLLTDMGECATLLPGTAKEDAAKVKCLGRMSVKEGLYKGT
jgi:hypothetical protein